MATADSHRYTPLSFILLAFLLNSPHDKKKSGFESTYHFTFRVCGVLTKYAPYQLTLLAASILRLEVLVTFIVDYCLVNIVRCNTLPTFAQT